MKSLIIKNVALVIILFQLAACHEETEFIKPAPTLKIVEVQPTSATIAKDPILGAKDYVFDMATDINFDKPVPGYKSLSIKEDTFLVTGLKISSVYYCRIYPVSADGKPLKSSNVLEVRTPQLASPVVRADYDVSETSINVKWGEVAGATDYVFEASQDKDFAAFLPGYDGVFTEGENYVMKGLSPNAEYFIRVKAKNDIDESNYSATVKIKTQVLKQIHAYEALDIKPISFIANWSNVTGADGYILEVSTDQNFYNHHPGYRSKWVGATVDTVFNLDINKDYYYRVRAVGDKDTSNYSEKIFVHTSVEESCRVVKYTSDTYTYYYKYNDKNKLTRIDVYAEGQSYNNYLNINRKVQQVGIYYNRDGTVNNAAIYDIDGQTGEKVLYQSWEFKYAPSTFPNPIRLNHYNNSGKLFAYATFSYENKVLVKMLYYEGSFFKNTIEFNYNERGDLVRYDRQVGTEVASYDYQFNPQYLLFRERNVALAIVANYIKVGDYKPSINPNNAVEVKTEFYKYSRGYDYGSKSYPMSGNHSEIDLFGDFGTELNYEIGFELEGCDALK